MKNRYILLSFLCLCFAFSTQAQRVFVRASASGTNNGTSWANAYTTLNAALADANAAEIWVAAATYRPGVDTNAVFNVTKTIAMYGGFAGTETMLSQRNVATNPTILSGDLMGNDIDNDFTLNKDDNTFHVIAIDSMLTGPVIIDGFTISGGHTNELGTQNQYFWKGGGIFSLSPTKIDNCIFNNNFARTGGSVWLGGNNVGAEVKNSTISNCSTNSQSAGIMIDTQTDVVIDNCDFKDNITVRGTVYPLRCTNLTIKNCRFTNNKNDAGFGGAMFLWSNVNSRMQDCTFTGNSANNGGCMYFDGRELLDVDPSNFIFERCTFDSNFGLATSAGIRAFSGNFTLKDCIFTNNNGASGTDIYANGDGGSMVYEDCTFRNATCSGWGGSIANYGLGKIYTIRNCIFEDNNTANLGGAANNGFAAKVTFDGCRFLRNASLNSAGGAIALQNDSTEVVVLDCYFEANSAFNTGGAIFAGSTSSSGLVTVDRSEFWNNMAGGAGGAIHVAENGDDDISIMNISNSIFNFNTAVDQGGALNMVDAEMQLISNVFYSNSASGNGTGGALSYNASDSNMVNVTLMNNTFYFNTGTLAGHIAAWTGTSEAVSNAVFQNNILFNEGITCFAVEDGTPNIVSNGGNMIDDATMNTILTNPMDMLATEPIFVSPDDFDFRLADTSPGVNDGVAAGAPDTDILGNPRLGLYDSGAYENQNVVNTKEIVLNNQGQLKISPNPSMGQQNIILNLDNEWKGVLQVSLVNMAGQTMYSAQSMKAQGDWQMTLSPEVAPKGVYFLMVSNGKALISDRIVRF